MSGFPEEWKEYLRFRQAFAGLLDEARYPLSWLDAQVMCGQFRIWTSAKAAILAEIRHYPSGAYDLHGMAAAGDLHEIIADLIPRAEAWGRSMGCLAAVIESRKGWARMLPAYHVFQTALTKDL